MRVLSPSLLLLVLAFGAPALPAQCTPFFGQGCTGGGASRIDCGTPPRIGTTWLACSTINCTTNTELLLIGVCSTTSVRIPASLACINCPTCYIDVLPILIAQPWNGFGCFGFAIPRDQSLVGGVFCVQNACLYPAPSSCVCSSNTIQVRMHV